MITPGPSGPGHTEGMDQFVVHPRGPLHGSVCAGGAKNSALKLMAACLLAEGRHVLSGVPHIIDVEIMADVLRSIGCRVTRAEAGTDGGPGDLLIDVPATLIPEAPYELVEKMRASVVVLGPLLARTGRARVSMPGGDDFGNRPIDIHLQGLTSLGAVFDTVHGYVEGAVPDAGAGGRLVGNRVVFEYPSHTATDNILMAAVLAKGTTVLENAAREPEVADLADMLTSMGARITGAGTSRIEVEGVDELHPTTHRVIPDRVVAATFFAAVGLTGGDVVVVDARANHMDMLLRKLGQMGVHISQ